MANGETFISHKADLVTVGTLFVLEDGELAVRIARIEIMRNLGVTREPRPVTGPVFKRKSGVFVTLNEYPSKELRGCIGFPEPIMELLDALKDAAVAAATRDPRFPPVSPKELESIVIDVTLLTPPEDIGAESPGELIDSVVIGRDGLIARMGPLSGLLLPQVPVEYNWSVEEFLSHTCLKAGLPPESWRRGGVSFKRFSGRVFGELAPGGKIEEMDLK